LIIYFDNTINIY